MKRPRLSHFSHVFNSPPSSQANFNPLSFKRGGASIEWSKGAFNLTKATVFLFIVLGTFTLSAQANEAASLMQVKLVPKTYNNTENCVAEESFGLKNTLLYPVIAVTLILFLYLTRLILRK